MERIGRSAAYDSVSHVGKTVGAWVLIAAAIMTINSAALAQPSRKGARKSQPVPISRTAPDMTATIPSGKAADDGSGKKAKPAAPAAPPTYKTVHFDEGLPKPFDLPGAPRARMRACGEKWQAIKMSGEARSDTWREFATKCLVETGEAKTAP